MSRAIQAWDKETQDTKPVEITWLTKLRLGCENNPVTTVLDWAELQDIDSLQGMCEYINNLDFNVEVIG